MRTQERTITIARRVLLTLSAALYLLALLGAPAHADAAVREYWVKAVNVRWDVMPNGGDPGPRISAWSGVPE